MQCWSSVDTIGLCSLETHLWRSVHPETEGSRKRPKAAQNAQHSCQNHLVHQAVSTDQRKAEINKNQCSQERRCDSFTIISKVFKSRESYLEGSLIPITTGRDRRERIRAAERSSVLTDRNLRCDLGIADLADLANLRNQRAIGTE